jgi:hypothetical protein
VAGEIVCCIALIIYCVCCADYMLCVLCCSHTVCAVLLTSVFAVLTCILCFVLWC